jgi:hypothetical protein
MIRASWLLHRTAFLLLLGTAVLLAAALVLDGLDAGAPFTTTTKAAVAAAQTATLAFNGKHVLQVALGALPALLGVFGAAPLLGQEAEVGTLRLAWTQTVTRQRWTWITLGLTLGAAGAAAGVLAIAGSWWDIRWAPWDGDGLWGSFDMVGPALVAYTAFAVAAGLALGALIGRTLPAMALTLAGYVGVRLLVELAVRPRFLPPLSFTESLGTPKVIQTLSQVWLTGMGTDGVVYYQPASRFWLFQGLEAAIFLGLAAILVGVAAWWLTRRVA